MSHTPKKRIFDDIEEQVLAKEIKIDAIETGRPWGGYFVIDESSAEEFIQQYFPNHTENLAENRTKSISPKILLVAPGARLSWQYHHRRSEIWRVIEGPVGIITSENDIQGDQEVFEKGDTIKLQVGMRHRLVGLQKWGIVAEIWVHEDAENPSDEYDIVRIEDDYGR